MANNKNLNLIPFIAEKLGVKMHQCFKISNNDEEYKDMVFFFDNDWLYCYNDVGYYDYDPFEVYPDLFKDLLSGRKRITEIMTWTKKGEV